VHLYGLPDDRPWSLEPPQRLRVLRYTDSGLEDPDPSSVEAVDAAAALLTSLGHEVVDGTNPLPWDDALREAIKVVMATGVASAAQQIAPGEKAELLHPYTRYCLEVAQQSSGVDFFRGQAALATAGVRLLQSVADHDVLLCPTTARPPVPVGYFSEGDDGAACADRMLAWSAYTPFANIAGMPAVSLPLHWTPDGLPVGVQLIGSRVGDDALLLRLAAQVEAAAPFADRHPAQW
jgi:amidase